MFRTGIFMRNFKAYPAGMNLCMHDIGKDLHLQINGDRTDHAAEIFNAELTKLEGRSRI
jgi:hypothetical protein